MTEKNKEVKKMDDRQENQDKKEYLAEIYRRNLDTVYRVCWLYMNQ